jgi:hypothetical protein
MNEFVIPSRDVCVIAIVSNPRSNQFQTATGSTVVLATLNDETKSDDSASSVFGMPNPVDYQRTKRVMGRAEEGEHRAMLEHERCLWLLLMYARPCSQHFTAEDMTSLCQMRYVSEDGTRYTKDVIVAKLVYRISDSRLLCTVDYDENAPLFFEKVSSTELAKKSSTRHQFPAYVRAIISTIPDRKYIYIPKVFARELRKESRSLHTKVYKFDKECWQMVCVGMRAWDWKQLMVKSIFFDDLAKVMTLSSVQLSLYGPIKDNQDLSLEKVYQRKELQAQSEAHKATSSVFGDLQYKLELLKTNNTKKQVQLVFTHHTKKRRQGSVRNLFHTCMTDFTQDKIPSITRQLEFVKYCNENMATMLCTESSRFMLVDKRIVSKFLPTNLPVQEQDEVLLSEIKDAANVLLHCLYLYLMTPSSNMLVSFRKQLYIKFPQDYTVIRTEHGYATGQIFTKTIEHKYATCFDTRTYSCVRPTLERKADSAEMMQMIP